MIHVNTADSTDTLCQKFTDILITGAKALMYKIEFTT